MVSELHDNALSANQKYLDQYVSISGKINVIDSSGNYFSICAMDNNFAFLTDNILCEITDNSQLDTISSLSIGDFIIVEGQIDSVGEVIGYHLKTHNIRK